MYSFVAPNPLMLAVLWSVVWIAIQLLSISCMCWSSEDFEFICLDDRNFEQENCAPQLELGRGRALGASAALAHAEPGD